MYIYEQISSGYLGGLIMAFDGIMTWAISEELSQKLTLGKIEKIYQPESEGLVFIIHTKDGRFRLYASASGNAPHMCITQREFENPKQPPIFCMILRKHIQGGRISRIAQNNSERIIEMDFQVLDELGFTVSKRLIFEIMGKHSNIVLVNLNDGRIIDSIKRVSIDVNRARQLLPGLVYSYPPSQGKTGFKELLEISTLDEPSSCNEVNHSDSVNSVSVNWHDANDIMDKVGGISPRVADCISHSGFDVLKGIASQIESMNVETKIYSNGIKITDFHIVSMDRIFSKVKSFDSPSKAVDYFFEHKKETNTIQQSKSNILKKINSIREKLGLKLQRMQEDVLKAGQSEHLRLYGELLTANLHDIKKGDTIANIVNYYDNSMIDIKLDPKLSPSENAQTYFKRYGKAMNTIKEKQPMINSVNEEIVYIDTVIDHLNRATEMRQIEDIKEELIGEGYFRIRLSKNKTRRSKASKSSVSNGKINNPLVFNLDSGRKIIVGRNNKENDVLSLKMSAKSDIWFHTKDIPGSHVVLQTHGLKLAEIEKNFPEEIKTAASIAAYHSKGKSSENVPVDYTEIKYVRKPNGAKPGMVIFKNNKTIWVTPHVPNHP